MMFRNSFTRYAIPAALLLAVLTACNSADPAPSPSPPPSPSPSAEAAAPVWTSGGMEDFYLLAGNEVHHYDALGDFLRAMNDTFSGQSPVQLVYGRYFQNQIIENTDSSPAFAAIHDFYQAEMEFFASENKAAAEALAETCRAGGTADAVSEDYDLGLRYEGRGLASFTQSLYLSRGGTDGGNVQSAEVFVLSTGERLTFDGLFTDPAEARGRTAAQIASVTGLSGTDAAALLTDYNFYLAEDGRVMVLCPGAALGDITLDLSVESEEVEIPAYGGTSVYNYYTTWYPENAVPLTEFTTEKITRLEGLGVHFVYGPVEFPMPTDLFDGLLCDFS